MTSVIRIVIMDPHSLYRVGIARTLRGNPRFEIVGEAASTDLAMAGLLALRPDVALIDATLLTREIIDQVLTLTAIGSTKAIVFFDERELHLQKLAGSPHAFTCVPKTIDGPELIDAIENVADNCTHAFWGEPDDQNTSPPSSILSQSISGGIGRLNRREREVLNLALQGKSNAEIAATLHLATSTVKSYLTRGVALLPPRQRTELIALSARTCERRSA